MVLKVTFNSNSQPLGFKSALAKISFTFVEDGSIEEIPISLKGTIEGLETITIPNNQIDFGDIALGVNNGPRKIKIKNTGNFTRSYSYTNNDSEITIIPSDFTLNPAEEIDLDVFVKVSNEGLFNKIATIKENECNLTFDIVIIGKSIKSEVVVSPLSLDYGVKSPCMTENQDVTITNNGQIGVTFVKAEIVGTNKDNFTILNVVNNIQLAKDGGNMGQTIAFVSPTQQLGTFTAELKITMLENGVEIVYTIPLTVEVKTGFEASPINTTTNELELDFGDVVVNQTKSLEIKLEATENWNIVTRNAIPTTPPAFIYNLVNLENATVVPGTPLNWKVDFTPNAVTPFTGQITLVYRLNNDPNCEEQIVINLKGNGKPASKVSLSLQDMVFDPTENEVKIPIFSRITEGLANVNNIKFDTLAISYNYTQFYPKSIDNGVIINSEITDLATNRAITYFYSNVFNLDTNSQSAVSLVGTPMLGNIVKDSVKIEYAKFDNETLIGEKIIKNGSIETKVCTEGDEVRLLKNSNQMKLSVESNNNIVRLTCQTIELGNHTLDIYSLTGELVYSNKWEYSLGMNSLFSFEIDKNKFGSGLYIVKFSSDNRLKIQKISILR